mgnify:CR=1 FL=1
MVVNNRTNIITTEVSEGLAIFDESANNNHSSIELDDDQNLVP